MYVDNFAETVTQSLVSGNLKQLIENSRILFIKITDSPKNSYGTANCLPDLNRLYSILCVHTNSFFQVIYVGNSLPKRPR